MARNARRKRSQTKMKIVIKRHCVRGMSVLSVTVLCVCHPPCAVWSNVSVGLAVVSLWHVSFRMPVLRWHSDLCQHAWSWLSSSLGLKRPVFLCFWPVSPGPMKVILGKPLRFLKHLLTPSQLCLSIFFSIVVIVDRSDWANWMHEMYGSKCLWNRCSDAVELMLSHGWCIWKECIEIAWA